MIAAEVPLFGTLIALIPNVTSDAGSPLPLDMSNNMRQLNDIEEDDDEDDDEDLDTASTVFAAAKRLGVNPQALGQEVARLLNNDEDADDDELDVAYDELEDALDYADVAY
jgi:O-phosphoseryl-tRNA(Cys) synthetase